MKLFKSLLVAPAALGLLSPLTATASEVNFSGISNYSNGEVEFTSNSFSNDSTAKPRLEAEEELVDSPFLAGGFSETTTASFSADFAIGSTDDDVPGTVDALSAYYGFQIDLSSSFTGDDSLDVSIDAGNGGGGLSELDLNDAGTDDALVVDGISYTFPIGPVTVFVGDNTDGSLLYNTACVYGGITNTLDDCGNQFSALGGGSGTAAGASFELGNGFDVALGYTGAGSGNGLMTAEGLDEYGGQISYTADTFGASVTYALVEGASSTDTTYYALNGYWTPSDAGSMPSISVGYETGDPENTTVDTSQWFVGVQWDEVGPGTLGAALGSAGAFADDATELVMYEAFYSYSVNDGMTLTPLVYLKETAGDASDETGVMVKTSFSF